MAKVTIAIPFHWMPNWQFFITRCLASIESQTFKDYEIVLINHSTMPVTSNRTIESAKGELVKVLYMDDYFGHENALQIIIDAFTPETKWLVTGCLHKIAGEEETRLPHLPRYANDISTGNNGIGSPSVLTFRKEGCLYFDEKLSWMLDCDLYRRYHDLYGPPKIVNDLNIVIGLHKGQTTHMLTDEQKSAEVSYLRGKI